MGRELNTLKKKTVLRGAASVLAGFALVLGCAKTESDSGSSATVGVSGTINAVTSSAFSKATDFALLEAPSIFSIVGYKIQCSTMDDPPQVVTAAINSDGTFSLEGVPPNSVGCQILDSSGTPVAPIVLSDSSEKDMKGKSKTVSRVQLAGDANLGSITFDTDAGTASATISNSLRSAMSSSAVSDPFDFTGSYTMQKFDGTLPDGYVSACTAAEQSGGNCHGPSEGESIYIKMMTGKSFTPDSTCAAAVQAGTLTSGGTCGGTTGTDNKYAIEVWKSQTQWATCGSKLGFSYAEAKGYGSIDLSSSGINEGTHTWSTVDGASHAITDGWKFANATAPYSMQNCESVQVGSLGGWKCYDNVASPATYQVNLDVGGCKTAAGVPVSNINWSNVNWSGAGYTTSNYDTVNYPGYTKSVSTPTYNGATITCTNVFGTFLQSNNSATSNSNFSYSNVSNIVTQNSLCSSINITGSTRKELAQLQCYANGLWNNSAIRTQVDSGNLCLRKVRANWGATDPAKFLEDHGPIKAEGQHVAELFDYTSKNSGTFRMREDDYRGVQNGNSYTTCHLENAITISVKKRSDGNLNLEFISEVKDLDGAVPACKSGETNMGVGTTRMLFKVVPQ